MRGHVINIKKEARDNLNFRRVIFTAGHCQLVVMSLLPKEDIGEEVHKLDQFINCEMGVGDAYFDGIHHELAEGTAVMVPAGTTHNITNTSAENRLQLYTIYAPPNHREGVIHATKAEAEADTTDHFDGSTTDDNTFIFI